MIYKFSFEVCSDDNQLITVRTEESGDFWKAFNHFLYYVTTFAMRII